MSEKTVAAVLRRAATDDDFRSMLAGNGARALALLDPDQQADLTDDEKAMLTALPTPVVNGLAGLAKPTTDADPAGAGRPSFKEIGAAVLSGLLVLLIGIPTVYAVIAHLGVKPTGVQIGQTTEVVDPFERSKELLGIVFPLLTATVTFWLGVAVEGRRADASTAAATKATAATDQARQSEQQAHREATETRAKASEALAHVDGSLAALAAQRAAGAPGGAGGGEGIEYRGGGQPAPGSTPPDLAALRQVVQDARNTLNS